MERLSDNFSYSETVHAVQEAAVKIPSVVLDRLLHAKNLSAEDRQAIVQIARQALVDFNSQLLLNENQALSQEQQPATPVSE